MVNQKQEAFSGGSLSRLDLHGVRHDDVDRVVENFVLLNTAPMRIVTGNSDRMVELVLDVLNRHNIDWERWGHGTIKILGDNNEG
jgi:hypothetical protein